MANDPQSRSQRRKQPTKLKKNKTKQPKKRNFGSGLLKFILFCFILGCVGLLAGMGLFWFYAKDAPKITDKALDSSISAVFYTADGEPFADLGKENRKKIAAQDIPQLMEDAIVSVEDRRFYKHIGIDPIRIIGSAVSNLTNGGSGGLQGGSTLTQQLIKLSYFSTKASDQTLKRKAQEAWLALQLEQKKSKQEILTYYINKVYMANGLYGMETAAETYFDKPLKDLDLAQTALLAGMPQAPNDYDPYQHKEAAKERRDIVLLTMKENKKITEAEYKQAKDTPIDHGLVKLKNDSSNWKVADNYLKEAIAEVEEKTGKNPYTDGLQIYTNLDLNAQKRLYDIVNTDQYVDYPDQEMQVASTLIDANNGKVLAQIGARHVEEGVVLGNNLAVNTGRDFGSTVKPITDYGPALQDLKLSTGKMILDEPYKYEGTDIEVKNWDNRYFGNITLRQALYDSRNVPAVKLFNEVGAETSLKFLQGLGINYKTIHQSNAISSNTTQDGNKYGVSSLKMAAAYAAFANGGTYYKPQYVSKIVYQDGSTDEFEAEGKKAMDQGTAYMVTDILKDVISEGTGTNALIDGLYQAGKTGTSNYDDAELAKMDQTEGVYPDITFVGYTKQYAISVWTGYNKKLTPITDTSSHVASDVYREFMQYATADVENEDWDLPSDLIRVGGELYWKDNYQKVVETTTSSTKTSSSSSTSTTSSKTSTTKTSSSTPESSSSVAPSSTTQTQPPVTSSTQPSSSSETPPPTSQQSSEHQGALEQSNRTTSNSNT